MLPVGQRFDLAGTSRLLALGVAGARVALGVVALTRPELPARLWVPDDDARRPAVQLLARALGGRDLALGAGAVVALLTGVSTPQWVVAGALADTGDVMATLAVWSSLPPVRRWVVAAIAGGAAVTGALTAPFLGAQLTNKRGGGLTIRRGEGLTNKRGGGLTKSNGGGLAIRRGEGRRATSPPWLVARR